MWAKRNKYGSTRVKDGARSFGSKLERTVYDILKLREAAGEISEVKCQPHVTLDPIGWKCIPDFSFVWMDTGKLSYCEAKGVECDRWKATKLLWAHFGPAPMEIWVGDWKKPFLKEIIKPDKNVILEWAGSFDA